MYSSLAADGPAIRLSAAARRIQPSAANAASQRARELRAKGREIIDLTTGEPDFGTPAHICDAAHAAMRSGQTKYTAVDGTPELKKAIIRKFRKDNELEYQPSEISVAAGAKQIIFNALMATLDPLDEVVIPTPCWVSYPEMVSLVGGKPVTVGADPRDPDWIDQIERAITPRTRWLMLNYPNNPSGRCLALSELRALADMLLRHPRVLILCDDIYEHILFDERQFHTLAQIEPRLQSRTLTVNGVSKAYSMTGWRIGYAGGPQTLISAMAKIQSQSTSAPSAISQAAAIAALEGPQDIVHERSAIFQSRRDALIEKFRAIPGLRADLPQGAFYLFLDCRELLGKSTPDGVRIQDDRCLTEYFVEQGVALVHGTPFGSPGYIRLSFAASETELTAASAKLRDACGALS